MIAFASSQTPTGLVYIFDSTSRPTNNSISLGYNTLTITGSFSRSDVDRTIQIYPLLSKLTISRERTRFALEQFVLQARRFHSEPLVHQPFFPVIQAAPASKRRWKRRCCGEQNRYRVMS